MRETITVAYYENKKLNIPSSEAKEYQRIKEILNDPTSYEVQCMVRGRMASILINDMTFTTHTVWKKKQHTSKNSTLNTEIVPNTTKENEPYTRIAKKLKRVFKKESIYFYPLIVLNIVSVQPFLEKIRKSEDIDELTDVQYDTYIAEVGLKAGDLLNQFNVYQIREETKKRINILLYKESINNGHA